MKILLTLIVVFSLAFHSKAQDFPLSRSKKEVREYKMAHRAEIVSQTDTCDVYRRGELLQEYYYYKDDKCYKGKQVYSVLPNEVFGDDIKTMQWLLNGKYKKLKENIWTNENGTERIELIVIEDKKQYAVQISPALDKN